MEKKQHKDILSPFFQPLEDVQAPKNLLKEIEKLIDAAGVEGCIVLVSQKIKGKEIHVSGFSNKVGIEILATLQSMINNNEI